MKKDDSDLQKFIEDNSQSDNWLKENNGKLKKEFPVPKYHRLSGWVSLLLFIILTIIGISLFLTKIINIEIFKYFMIISMLIWVLSGFIKVKK